jgi:hypothetical protein
LTKCKIYAYSISRVADMDIGKSNPAILARLRKTPPREGETVQDGCVPLAQNVVENTAA